MLQSNYVRIPNINLQQSFTIQLWVYVRDTIIYSEYGLFSQCDSNVTTCLLLSIRDLHITFSFDSMKTNGSILIGTSLIGYHVTAVYNALTRQQLVYINSRLDAISYGNIELFQGLSLNARTYLGVTSSYNYSTSYLNG